MGDGDPAAAPPALEGTRRRLPTRRVHALSWQWAGIRRGYIDYALLSGARAVLPTGAGAGIIDDMRGLDRSGAFGVGLSWPTPRLLPGYDRPAKEGMTKDN